MGRPKKRPAAGEADEAKPAKRSQPTVEEKLLVLDWYHRNGRNQEKTADHFRQAEGFHNLSQSSVSRWVRMEEGMRQKVERGDAQRIRIRAVAVKHPALEECLNAWIDRVEQTHSSRLTGELIRSVAAKFYDRLGVPAEERLALSNGWLDGLKQRRQLKFYSEKKAAASSKEVQAERTRVAELVAEFLAGDSGRSVDDVWNADETSFFYACAPDRALAEATTATVKQSSSRLTVCLAANASGSQRRAPLFIGKDERLQEKAGHQLGFKYAANKTAWMTGDVFAEWLRDWNAELKDQKRHILLLLDNFSGHRCGGAKLSHIRIEYLAPNLNAQVQPSDAGVIRTFKALFRRNTVMRSIDKLFSDRAANVFEIDQLTAMHLAVEAWHQVSDETIRLSWRQTKILPGHEALSVSRTHASAKAVELLAEALKELQDRVTEYGIAIDVMDGVEFVDLESNEKYGFELCMEEILQQVHSLDEQAAAPASASVDVDKLAEQDEGDAKPSHVDREVAKTLYKSLLDVEDFWRSNAYELSPEMRQLLQNTRVELKRRMDGMPVAKKLSVKELAAHGS